MKIQSTKSIGLAIFGAFATTVSGQTGKAPNVVFVLADEWRNQDLGYNANKDVLTPNLDRLASHSINFSNTISCCPVSCPYRGSLLTGQYPLTTGVFVNNGKKNDMLINTPDLMPTLLGLCGLPIPETVEGDDKSPVLLGKMKDTTGAVLIASYQPFGQWSRNKGGKDYRGVRTKQYTYARDIKGPWLLFDNQKDKYQMNNLVDQPEYADV